MTDHSRLAEEYFLKGYNCTQSVAVAFADELCIPEPQLLRMSAGFGGGFGRMREVCGAFSGIVLVISSLYGNDDPKNKSAFYAEIQELAADFKKRCETDSIVCRELLGLPGRDTSPNAQARTTEYYKKRPCLSLVKAAASIAEDYICSHPVAEHCVQSE